MYQVFDLVVSFFKLTEKIHVLFCYEGVKGIKRLVYYQFFRFKRLIFFVVNHDAYYLMIFYA